MRALYPCITASLALAACATLPAEAPEPQVNGMDRSAFVQGACAGCHAVEAGYLSPNPAAPSFEAIANRDGLTRASLAAFLADAHNYPVDMDFTLDQAEVEAIADYVLLLRDDSYRPVPQ